MRTHFPLDTITKSNQNIVPSYHRGERKEEGRIGEKGRIRGKGK
jgi:hypothetical protein